jgi:hypothetical protein
MTDLENYWPPSEPTAVETPRRCRRHQWVEKWLHPRLGVAQLREQWEGTPEIADAMKSGIYCARCNAVRDDAKARRGKTARNRGNAYEREVAAKLGGRRVGQYGDQVDVDVPGYLRVQTKNGGAYPKLIDRWLRAIPVEAGLLRAVVVGDAPGPGTRRRSLIVFDLDEWAMWHGGPRND